jgi:formylglycine-generating enzyme required for sulfatase activity
MSTAPSTPANAPNLSALGRELLDTGGSKPSGPWVPPTAEELGKLLPEYDIVKMLGRGGMGAVYMGRQISLDRPVAIKILSNTLDAADASFAERFKNEARAMGKLNHPGIVTVYAFGETAGGLLYIVMEYVEGTDVARMIAKSGRLHTDHAMAITAHVCDALAYAHERGIIHLDIKPANIMVGYDGNVKVADFGLAKVHGKSGETLGLTQSGMAMGTLHYMAPEALMLGSAVDHRADIYAVGVMLYQMLTGKVPHGMFELPSLQVPGLDPRYDEIIAKAMREDRERRFQQITELRRDLDGILTQPVVKVEADASHAPAALPTQARPPRPAGQPYRPPQRQMAAPPPKQSSSGMFMWVTLAAVLVAGGAWWLKRTPTAEPQPVVAQDTPAHAKPAATVPQATTPVATTPTPAASLPPELAALNTQFIDLQQERVIAPFEAELAKLNSNYLGGIARKITEEQAAGHAADVLALETEQKRITTNQPVPETDAAATPASLKALRSIYRDALAKIIASRTVNLQALTGPLDKRLVQMAADFTQSKRLTDAQTVRSYREALALKDGHTNTLGMKFVPVPGTSVLFGIHEVRYQDYAAYASESPSIDGSWKDQSAENFTPTDKKEQHPVTKVSWEDAQAFCAWLSQKEGKTYRLPTDEEWSIAVGLNPEQRPAGTTPVLLSRTQKTKFPWGGGFPPKSGDKIGNYRNEGLKPENASNAGDFLDNYEDGFPTTAPVMTFMPNQFGLYDMGGNVWEWCEDWSNAEQKHRVMRGGSWDCSNCNVMFSSYRNQQAPVRRYPTYGFRCVLVASSAHAASAAETPPPTRPPAMSPITPAATLALKDGHTNTLGMTFVPVPGTSVLFGIHEVRYQDYAVYAANAPGVDDAWKDQSADGFTPTDKKEQHPVMKVSWEDAQKFCAWLSQKEGKTYRLPTDQEWSIAVGIGGDEKWQEDTTPASVFKSESDFPWGTQWPPLQGSGNYSDESRKTKAPNASAQYLANYDDGFPTTAPVMSFQPNKFGLYDLGGNVWEWCEDRHDTTQKERVLRGGSWGRNDRTSLLSSQRAHYLPGTRYESYGFRIVLVASSSAAVPPINPAAATLAPKDGYTNTLGMKFVPVPGTRVMFCIHETRYQDYAAYAAESPDVDKTWQDQNHDGFVITERAPEHPVTMVDWEDSSKFCLWLSKKEGKAYRLPTDREWSCAAGLGDYEKWDAETTPATVNKHQSDYPWNGSWPPPTGSGNYSDQSRKGQAYVAISKFTQYLDGFNDGFPTTAPVMSFRPNKLGLYDIGGNLWEWCEDWYDNTKKQRIGRGSSWASFGEGVLRTSSRQGTWQTNRSKAFGFRVVLELP